LKNFTSDILIKLNQIINVEQSDSYFCTFNSGQIEVLASSGKFKNESNDIIITPKSFEYLNKAHSEQTSFFDDDVYVGFFKSNDNCIFLYIEGCKKLSTIEKKFLDIFSNNITVAYNNICLNQEIVDTQKEMIERITEMVETRSNETANHVKRVASISYILAKAYGLSEQSSLNLKLASPMHDIGKIGIPDDILQKPGKLEQNEYAIMKTHVDLGYEIFKGSNKEILKIASIVAHEHHEKWDGTGYPQGLKEEEISIYGRITAIADVFDSLTQKRVYKEPWSIQKVLDFFVENKGTHFDPKLVELFISNIDEIEKFKDGSDA
jgi:response regulator RpfG family c-di-GMP phosphodiesterase